MVGEAVLLLVALASVFYSMAGKGGKQQPKGTPRDSGKTGPGGKQASVASFFKPVGAATQTQPHDQPTPVVTQATAMQAQGGAAQGVPEAATIPDLNESPVDPPIVEQVQGLPPLPARRPAEQAAEPSSSSDSEGDQAKKKRKRTFQVKWVLPETQGGYGLTWIEDLVVDKMTGARRLFCKTCREAKLKNDFTEGGSSSYRLHTLRKHAKSGDHRTAQAADDRVARAGAIHQAAAAQASEAEAKLHNNIALAYWLCWELLPFLKMASLCDLFKQRGFDKLHHKHQARDACKEFAEAASDVLSEEESEDVKRSPFFGLIVDESTSMSVDEHMIAYVVFMKGATVVVRFVELVQVAATTAVSLKASIMELLNRRGWDVLKMMGFGSDGAAVMVGVHGGVSTLLVKEENPFMTSSHCGAHREALAAKDAADSCAYSKDFDNIVNSLAVFFARSPQRSAKLKEVQAEVGDKSLRLAKLHKVRWLSRCQAVQSIFRSHHELLVLFAPGGPEPHPEHFENLSSFRFIFALCFLVVLLEQLSILNKAFQRAWVDPTQVKQHVDSTISAIQEYFINTSDEAGPDDLPGGLGSEVRSFWFKFLVWKEAGYVDRFKYSGFDVRFSPEGPVADAAFCKAFMVSYAKGVVKNLQERFPDRALFESFAIFSPAHYPSTLARLSDWGTGHLEVLKQQYGVERTARGVVFEPIVDWDAVLTEWPRFKSVIFQMRQAAATSVDGFPSLDEVVCRLYGDPHSRESYPNLLKLGCIALVQACSSAEAERGFSLRTLIHSKLRNRLKIGALDDCMRIKLCGPAKPDSEFLSKVYRKWLSRKPRRVWRDNPAVLEELDLFQSDDEC
ncbi:hypothetical protein KFL_003060070 [Klebsormidium nitens]|uniref:Uncharacterized protein n=1 Tax=Klebsormidium nitens TaxID=105231 RepID=A0A1Y1IF19_KLENI|nr:hypothetical protein KFL_003060070 [Klebsormidium nitens]|eukprot:GAQ86708.1 hypothetical protein KFL_003060070 [Klebsormidium nitens]